MNNYFSGLINRLYTKKKKKKIGGREGAHAPYKGGKRDTLTLHLSQQRPCHSRAAPEADITPHTLGAT